MDPFLPLLFIFHLGCLSPLLASSRALPFSSDPLPRPPPLFVFGASMVDTGENAVAMPLRSSAEFPPYGVDYFGKPAGRFSNGRVFMDSISLGLGYGLIDPFLKSLGADFRYGVNFASSGSTARNSTLEGNGSDSIGLFSLSVQLDQFKEFQTAVYAAQSRHGDSLPNLPSTKQFTEAVYFIETAHNDYISTAFKTPDFDAPAFVAEVISAMNKSLRVLYNLGARNIIVMNVTPLGCTPVILATRKADLDEYGCNYIWNDLISLHNKHLEDLLDDLRTELPLANWIVFDAYALMLDGYRNPSKYGVKYPWQACCGAGGPYNFVNEIRCGKSGYINGTYVVARRCEDPSLHIIWDSLHPVDSFGHYIAQGVLNGSYLRPYFNIKQHILHRSE